LDVVASLTGSVFGSAAPDATDRPILLLAFEVPQTATDRVSRYPGYKRHCRDPTTSCRPRLTGHEQTQAALIEMWRKQFISLANRSGIDHQTSVWLDLFLAITFSILFVRSSHYLDSFLTDSIISQQALTRQLAGTLLTRLSSRKGGLHRTHTNQPTLYYLICCNSVPERCPLCGLRPSMSAS